MYAGLAMDAVQVWKCETVGRLNKNKNTFHSSTTICFINRTTRFGWGPP